MIFTDLTDGLYEHGSQHANICTTQKNAENLEFKKESKKMISFKCNYTFIRLWHDSLVKLFWIKNVILFIECFFFNLFSWKEHFLNLRKYCWENKVRERIILFCWEIIMFWLSSARTARPLAYQITYFKHSCTKCYFKKNLTCLWSSFF